MVRSATQRPRALAASTLCEAFQITAAERPDQVALRMQGSDYAASFADYAATVRSRAAAFAAHGVGHGDTVGFMLVNRPALHLFDAAAMHLGAVCLSVYNTSSPEQIEHVLGDADTRIVVTELQFLARIQDVQQRLPSLQTVIVVDADQPMPGVMTVEVFERAADPDFPFEATWRAVRPDDVLCLIYTSGTTGPPKGVELTHDNMLSQCRAVDELANVTPGGRSISFLPTAHVADRWSQLYGQMVYGHTIHCCPDPQQFVAYSAEVRPTVWGGVPRIWEKLKSALEAGFATEPDPARREAIQTALACGLERARAKQAGRVPAALEARWSVFDQTIFSAIRAKLGLDACEWFAVGAAPTPAEVILFFDAIGIEIAELWGLSETAAIATLNPPGRIRIGTVGMPIPGVELRLADDDEILVRGPTVMRGYRNQPEATAETIDTDGWLHTGDVGTLDDDGYLRVVDRKKELIINAAGKNMSPANIEARIKEACPLVAQCVAIGDGRPYNVALITLEPDACAAFAAAHALPDPSPGAMAAQARVREAVAVGVDTGNARLSRVEQIKRFAILGDEWQPGSAELTPTMKLRRTPIADKYAATIESLYAPERT